MADFKTWKRRDAKTQKAQGRDMRVNPLRDLASLRFKNLPECCFHVAPSETEARPSPASKLPAKGLVEKRFFELVEGGEFA
ncbi:MAG: hypothetical protein WEE51_04710, partial [Pirellulaceae bacterium]